MKAEKSDKKLLRAMSQLKSAGLGLRPVLPIGNSVDGNLSSRVYSVFPAKSGKDTNIIFFVMYDISNDKVRSLVMKYLMRKGCMRIQKSIYLANLSHKEYHEIYEDLKAVQECYDNEDSIILVPVQVGSVESMKVIGESLDTDLITGKTDISFF